MFCFTIHLVPSSASHLFLERILALLALCLWTGFAEIDAELSAIYDLLLENFSGTGGAGHVDEVCMSKTSRLAGSPVNGNTYIQDVANVTEEVVEVLV